MITPGVYNRICLWQPNTGYVVDLYRPDIVGAGTPTHLRQYTTGGGGSEYVTGRDRTFEIVVTEPAKIAMLKRMRALGCPLQAFAIGWGRGVLWLDSTAFELIPVRSGPGSSAGERLRFRNHAFTAIVADRTNLLSAFDWFGKRIEQEVADGAPVAGSYFILGDDGLNAPYLWHITGASAAPRINDEGRLILGGGTATLTFPFPLGGASVTLDVAPGTTATVNPVDWQGGTSFAAAIAAGVETELPPATWQISISITGTAIGAELPSLRVTKAGRYSGITRTGLIPPESCAQNPDVRPEGVPEWAITSEPAPNFAFTVRSDHKIWLLPFASVAASSLATLPGTSTQNENGRMRYDRAAGYLFADFYQSSNGKYPVRRFNVDPVTGALSNPFDIYPTGYGLGDIDRTRQVLYTIAADGKTIYEWDYNGVYLRTIITASFQPDAIAVDPTGNHLYFLERLNDRAWRIDLETLGYTMIISGAPITTMNVPYYGEADEGYWFVEDLYYGKRYVFNGLTGATIAQTAGLGGANTGTSIDRENNKVYFWDHAQSALIRANYDLTGQEIVRTAAQAGVGSGFLWRLAVGYLG